MIYSLLKKFSNSQILASGFFIIILIGALVLNTKLASANGENIGFLNAFFTATSSVCVTGLIVVDTGTYWSDFGKFIIMLLVQIGGLGFMTLATFGIIFTGKKISLSQRLLIQDSIGSDTLNGVVKMSKNILFLSLIIEFIGAAFLSFVFIPEYGLLKGVWYSIFHSITAFCNAGFDIIGNFSSLTKYYNDIIINFTIMALIILGGLGFSTIFEIGKKRKFKKFSLHTKIVIITSLTVTIVPTILFFLFEMNNPKTIGNMNFFEKILISLFQVVSPRTAGYNTIDINSMKDSTKFLSIILMFIGGSPASTAGGLKTTTFAVIMISVYSLIKERDNIECFGRTIPYKVLNKALINLIIGFFIVIIGTMIVSYVSDIDFLTILYEITSAYATVGLTLGVTPSLNNISKILIILIMYIGRVGSLTVLYTFVKTSSPKKYKYPQEEVNIG